MSSVRVLAVLLLAAACASQKAAVGAPMSPAATPAASNGAASASPAPSAFASAPAPAPAPTAGLCRTLAVAGCSDPTPPSFGRDVRPILERRCFRCHAGEGVAADEHDFSKWEVLRAQRALVTQEISTCAMPPRAPLPEEEATTLLRWVACGALADP